MDEKVTQDTPRPRTIEEIAAEIGVSVTTVRLVINGQAERYRISARTRQAVEAYVAKHGYVVDHAGRSLKLRRSDAVGCIVPDLANAHFARLIAQLEERCRNRGLVLLTASTHEKPERERQTISGLLARGVDGIIISPCEQPEPARFVRRGQRNVATVVIDRAFPKTLFPTVVGDNEASARRLTGQIMAESGGDVFFLCARPEMPSIAARIAGFTDAFGAAGASERLLTDPEDDSASSGHRLMADLLARLGRPPKSFISSSLLILEGAIQALVDRFGSVPRDIILGTFDYHPLMELSSNRVLSVRQDTLRIADVAFTCLVDAMEKGSDEASSPVHVIPGALFADRQRLPE
ncbi:LacI family DNA-binding transcriptional regulator [Pleomorphomonas sp. NRK KF1]|uniref:LacI family DNA-binding transcriptional regulator n=1 Tax=Pleomorphomonas sp. NRK KF1 TaxID=2943000 RepID=UPI00204497D6|nr:LacI family DNA-binding transcriptional regulator [Pleomorphomonas sp. NRK KF1]MCM5553817.1 LacI family DNA-binding transcriptional regulator [Pleomorphomonas sp. NRK KF1]